MKRDQVLISFGNRVRELRKQRGLSQEKLGFETELDQTYISDIERGFRNVSLRNIAAIANALEVTLPELFDGVHMEPGTNSPRF